MAQVTIGGGRVVCEMDEAAQDEYKRVVDWLQTALTERDALRAEGLMLETVADALKDERDAARASAQLSEAIAFERLGEMYRLVDQRNAAIAEVAQLRAALVSLVDGKSEFDIEFDTGMPADEARRIMDLAYQRK